MRQARKAKKIAAREREVADLAASYPYLRRIPQRTRVRLLKKASKKLARIKGEPDGR
jgi:hypothetical protein